MIRVEIRCYEELNDFLPPDRRKRAFDYVVEHPTSVMGIARALGLPADEVDLVLVNGESVDFECGVQHGDRITFYPTFEAMDIGSLTRLRNTPLRQPRFLADAHLGRLATYLRMLGFDTLYQNSLEDEQLVHLSRAERRILLSRDRKLLERKAVERGYLVRETNPRLQLLEVLERFDLRSAVRPFRRCLRCNGLARPVPKASVAERLPAVTREHFEQFWVCQCCGRVYWKGSHYHRMRKFIQEILAALKAETNTSASHSNGESTWT
jgi:uncharacterized protein with PIN domain